MKFLIFDLADEPEPSGASGKVTGPTAVATARMRRPVARGAAGAPSAMPRSHRTSLATRLDEHGFGVCRTGGTR